MKGWTEIWTQRLISVSKCLGRLVSKFPFMNLEQPNSHYITNDFFFNWTIKPVALRCMCCFLRNVHFTHDDKWNWQWLLHSHKVLCPKSCRLAFPNYFQRGGKGHPLNVHRWEGLGLGTANHLCTMDGDEKDLKHLTLWSCHWKESKTLCVHSRIGGRSVSVENLSRREQIL